ncbi:MAG: HD domain-containing phosphohydrolase [Thermodesulfobacteriota bacterium]
MKQSAAERVLVVDDEPDVREIVSRWLTMEGYRCSSASSGEMAVTLMEQEQFQLVITDIMMPGMSGMDLLAFMKSRFPEVAVIMLTAMDDRKTALMAFEVGAWGYILKPFDLNDVLLNVKNALERRRLVIEKEQYDEKLEKRIEEQSSAVREVEEEMVSRLLAALESHHDETFAHIKRVGLYAKVLAGYLGWEEELVEQIGLAAQLHDIGKIAIPDDIVHKPSKLSPEEEEVMKAHTILGARILDGSKIPFMKMAKDIALSHHEKWDGTGYPQALSRIYIPESARIVTIVDVYDRLTHKKLYRPAFLEERAVSIMNAYKPSHFDPRIFDYFISVLPQIRAIGQQCEGEKNGLDSSLGGYRPRNR